MPTVYTFSEKTARELGKLVYQLRNDVAALKSRQHMQSARNPIEFAKPTTTLEPGGACTGVLQVGDGAGGYTDSLRYDAIDISDPFSWAFAVGTDDYSATTHILPVCQSIITGKFEVIAPTNLIQRAKPDSTIATGSTGTVSIYANETDTTVNVTARVKWGDNGEGWTSAKEGWIRWNLEAAEWEWVGGDCE